MTHVNQKSPLFIFSLEDGFAQIFSQIVPIRVRKLSNTNFTSLRHIKKEKSLLLVDVRRSNSPFISYYGGGGGERVLRVGVLYDNFLGGVQHVYCAKFMLTVSHNGNPIITNIYSLRQNTQKA